MEIQFLTLLNNNNDWLDWVNTRYDNQEEIERPKEFPCYVGDECIGYADKDNDDDCEGDALFWPTFLYAKDLEEMLEKL